MMAQSAFRCSWTDLSNGASGSAGGFDVDGAFAGLTSPCFSGAEWEVEILEIGLVVWVGFLGDSPRELFDEKSRILVVLEVCGGSCLRNWY